MQNSSDTAEDDILRSWHANAGPWTEAVRTHAIASRKLVTDQAIVDAVLSVQPRCVLDIGCGEGWLARALHGFGMDVVGIDCVAPLVEEAKRLGGGVFETRAYADIAAGSLAGKAFDAAVCNFSLLGQESVESLMGAIATCLNASGYLIVQTLHPVVACGNLPYRDGWRAGSWAGFGAAFSDPAPWYFRTLSSWYTMLRRGGFDVVECREPTARGAATPSSVIFIGRQQDTRR